MGGCYRHDLDLAQYKRGISLYGDEHPICMQFMGLPMIIRNEYQDQQPEWLSIFNTRRFFDMHCSGRRGIYLAMQDEANSALQAVVHLTEAGEGDFRSPLRGTYGGFEFSRNDLGFIERSLQETERAALELGAKKLTFTQSPGSHSPALSSCSFNVFYRSGYCISGQELNHSISVTNEPLMGRINRANQKRWRKCEREGFVFAEESDTGGFQRVFNTISNNRVSKGYKVSMTIEALMEMRSNFPGKIHFFSCSYQGNVAAAAVCMAIRSDILYVFYWGDEPGYEQFSPVAYLAERIYSFAMENGFKILDVGTSTLQGIPNYGLINFKEALGFQPSLKLTFSKELT